VRRALPLLLTLALATPAAAAPSLQQKRTELRQVRRQLEEQRTRLRAVKRAERRTLRDLEAMDQRLEAEEARLRALARELAQTRVRAQATGRELALVRQRLARQRALLGGRLREIYKYGRRGYVDVLLDVTDFAEFVARAHFLTTIMQADARLIAEYDQDAERYARLHEALVADQARIAELIAETRARREAVAAQARAKQALLARIQRERALYEEVVEELERTDRELVQLIQRMQAAAPGAIPAGRFRSFLWPARGVLTSGFGLRVHPIFRVRRMHSGVDVAAPWGAPVVAAWDGTVIYAGWFGGYGKIVILDHGEGLSTLYAHLSAILTRPGERVRRGEVIGRVGSTGYSTGPHVHFEIRVNGQPVDPQGR
jgi:murein DD-endopeptidase MepM/ murein hydrolase activator NlpD